MAKTGVGTSYYLRKGFLPVPVYFYSPIPDLEDLEKRNIWIRRSSLIDWKLLGVGGEVDFWHWFIPCLRFKIAQYLKHER